MSVNISEQDILNVFLESDTDEEDCLIDETVTEKENKFTQNLNNLDHADTNVTIDVDPRDYHANINSGSFESPTEEGIKIVNITSKYLADLASISPPANIEETGRGYAVRQIGEALKPRHICLDCGKHYSDKNRLKAHRRLHLGINLHTCEFCQKQFAVKRNFENHVRTHTREKPFKCPRCLKKFGSGEALSQHKKRCINLDNLDNKITFDRYSNNLERRKETRRKPSQFTVDITSINPPASSGETRRGFMVREIGESLARRFICLDCGKHYSDKNSISVHRRLHIGTNLHTCEFCQKQWTNKQHYDEHVRTHTGEKPFTCPRCMKSFGSYALIERNDVRCEVGLVTASSGFRSSLLKRPPCFPHLVRRQM